MKKDIWKWILIIGGVALFIAAFVGIVFFIINNGGDAQSAISGASSAGSTLHGGGVS